MGKTKAAPLTAEDRMYIAAVRQAEADIHKQELRVAAASKQASQERAALKQMLGKLRACAAELPLFDGEPKA